MSSRSFKLRNGGSINIAFTCCIILTQHLILGLIFSQFLYIALLSEVVVEVVEVH